MVCRTTCAVVGMVMLTSISIGNGQKSASKEISTKVGKTFSVTLDENPSTGYQLAMLSTGGEPWKLVSRKYVQKKSEPGMTGVGGKTTFTFRATKKGAGVLAFVNVQMFSLESTLKESTPVSYSVTVK
jgi:inhibitor of cysteine peptidase